MLKTSSVVASPQPAKSKNCARTLLPAKTTRYPIRAAVTAACRDHRFRETSPDQQLRHSGAPRSGEPGIHNPGLWLWIPGSRPSASPRNDATYDSNLGIALLGRLAKMTSSSAAPP